MTYSTEKCWLLKDTIANAITTLQSQDERKSHFSMINLDLLRPQKTYALDK